MVDETAVETPMIPDFLKRFAIDIDSVTPHPDNPREGDVGHIAASLTYHGQYMPIQVQKSTMRIVKGNHTWRAAQSLGWPKIAAFVVDLDDVEAKKRMLQDNESSDRASNNKAALVEALQSLPDLDGSGFDLPDLDDLIRDLGEPLDLGGAQPEKDPTVQYVIVFDDPDQQGVFYRYLRWLGHEYPDAESQAERIVDHLTTLLPHLAEGD